jgi:adenylate cyclase
MAPEGYKRKLTTILSADVAGYSRLMGEDEAATVKTLTNYREIMADLIKQHRGRVVDSPGDNLLAEFTSVVDAVQCAVAVQKEFQARNAELPENRRMEFRIGINLGDVIEEEDRIYGDGVNIAARLEALAEPGGICVSKTAFDQIETKLPLGYEYLGEQEVKNIPKPVGAYRVLMEPRITVAEVVEKKKAMPLWRRKAILAGSVVLVLVVTAALIWNFYFRPPSMEVASVEKMAYPLPDKPSIAVLAFTNMSDDPRQEYFCDGITEEIITALSKTPRMFVIARNSTFSYKGKQVKVQQVAEELGVRYVLEGSIRKSEDRVRVTAQLIDAITGRHLWAERYDKNLEDIFVLQDQITLKILNSLQVKLTEGEAFSAAAKGTDNLEAYLKWLLAREYMRKYTREGMAMGRKLAEEAIALDSDFPWPYLSVSATHIIDSMFGWSESPKQSLKLAEEMAQKALALDNSLAAGHSFLGRIHLTKRQYNKAISEGERAIVLAPNSDFAHAALAYTLHRVGRQEEAIGLYKKAIRLNPHSPGWYFSGLGSCYRMMGQYEKAVREHMRNLQKTPTRLGDHIALAATYILMGREEDARAEAEEVLRLHPKFSAKHFAEQQKYKDQADTDRLVAALRKAGLPETPPLPLPDKPSIAVLPFVNMSGDPEQEYFSDGITEEIITALSKTPKLFVIARTSSFKYKGKEVDVRTVGRELGVRHVLEGSVRRSSDRVRITAQLVDAKNGNHVWAERYDRNLKDIFALQDEITMKIITALQVKLTEGEQSRIWAKRTKNLELYLKRMEALALWNKGTKEDFIRFGQVAQELVDMAPESAYGYRVLGWYYWRLAISSAPPSPRKPIAKAFKLAKKALSLDESDSLSYTLLGGVYLMMRQYEKAIAAGERAIALNPNGAFEHGILGMMLSFVGRPDKGIDHLRQGIRLNPFPEYWYFLHLGRCYNLKKQHEKALAKLKKALQLAPGGWGTQVSITTTYSLLGREEEARAEAAEVLKINPKFSLERYAKMLPYKNQADVELEIDALRKAGLK